MINKLTKIQRSAAVHAGLTVRENLLKSRPDTVRRAVIAQLENAELSKTAREAYADLMDIADEMSAVATRRRAELKIYAQDSADREFGRSDKFAKAKPTAAHRQVLTDTAKPAGAKPWQFIKFQDGAWRNRSDCSTRAAAVGYASTYFADVGRSADNPIGAVFAVCPAENVVVICRKTKTGIVKSAHVLSELVAID